MPLDAICLSAVVRETAAQVENTRIEKIQQPARDQVVLLLRGGRRLLLCAGATQPRLHLTALLRDNPSQPPMFCMLLRKHLAGGRIVSVEQEPLERVVTLHIQAADELGEQRPWRLILEAMPRHANLILVDHQGRITDCLRPVDFEMSQQRQVLPGLFYHLPPRQEKHSPLEVSREELTYLESVVQELSQAESEQDFNDIRAELESGGYLKNRGKKQPGFQRASKPRQFTSSAGLRILVGRSNRQNDRLTVKDADRRDIWLHTQKIHGSHVILCTGGQEPDETSLYEAACLAAYYSQGREAGKVPVDYTPVRYVKKPAGSRPGMVVYTTYQTIYAVPDGQLVKKLAAKA